MVICRAIYSSNDYAGDIKTIENRIIKLLKIAISMVFNKSKEKKYFFKLIFIFSNKIFLQE
jgi:hypothetical protein